MTNSLHFLIVDDHKLFAAGLTTVLRQHFPDSRISECHSGVRALALLEEQNDYDLVLLDIELPAINGLDLLRAVKSRNLPSQIVVLSASTEDRQVIEAMREGALGYITKTSSPETMVSELQKVLDGDTSVPAHLAEAVRADAQGDNGSRRGGVSARQLEVLRLMELGRTNKQIAEILNISQSTVKFHIAGLFRQLGVKTRTECIHVAREKHLTS